MKKNFLTILLRIRNENLFLESFIKHYFAEGVDEIHILDDNSTQPFPDIVNDERVFIYEASHFKSHHEKLIDATKKAAGKDYRVYASHSQDPKKN